MKKSFLIVSAALMLTFGATSCKKCVVCTNDKGEDTKFCSKDEEARDNFVRGYTILGQTCKDAI